MSRRIKVTEDFIKEKPPKSRLDELQRDFDKRFLVMSVTEFEDTLREIHILRKRKQDSRSLVIK